MKKTRFYGDGGTIHGSETIDVEVKNGKVVAVWFRCQTLPFKVTEVGEDRKEEMQRMYFQYPPPKLHGVTVEDSEAWPY